MQFGTYFRLTSYATIAAAALALYVAGGVGLWLLGAFALVMVVAFKLEDSRWQLSERLALAVILVSIPFFYLDWQVLTPLLLSGLGDAVDPTGTGATEGGSIPRGGVEVAVLSHLILFLSAVKLFQRKHDRDWFFLYLISFFTVLLAAGLTASPMFLGVLILYLLCALSTIVAFEIQKARKKVTATQTRLLVPPDSTLFQKLPMRLWRRRYLETRRLPLVSVALLILIVILALPFFLIAPRTASSALRRGGAGISGFVGFSDSVTLGQIGQLKRNDEIFMRVRIDEFGSVPPTRLRWRGVALDSFTGKAWKKSAGAERFDKKESNNGLFKLGTAESLDHLTTQTFFMEPVDTPVLFGAPRVVGVRGNLPFVRVDAEGAIQTRPHDQERLVYRVHSDTSEPSVNALRNDRLQYVVESVRYLELPANLDPRIRTLTRDVIQQSEARTWYDAARAVESHLRDGYGYSLEMKASGSDPLADFLFNVKQGHCEYFATAMAVMLRTQGVATRLVNGFLPGEFNDASGAFTVRQSDAHSWVEVYFPETKSWVTFDPTPSAGRAATTRTGFAGMLSKYSEALELMWFQYVVGYDKQEQRSLVISARNKLFDLQRGSVNKFAQARAAFPALIGPILLGVTSLFGLMAAVLLTRRVRRFGWRRGLTVWRGANESEASRVEFYERLLKALEKQGIKRELYETPLEFASATGVNEARDITNAYNRVRFGEEKLSDAERSHIESLLARLEQSRKNN
ncbi:MAG TPA: transglutaminaseTgpA domain-containing protein [Pyrinomonadaceae bacterium]|nr:transglutaminaseTgpA domain-containing protein [Pyrinomonadaceae bacterium]